MDSGLSDGTENGGAPRAHLIDSAIFGHQWGTADTQAFFSEQQRVQRWVEILAALARAQAGLGIIPSASAETIGELVGVQIDLTKVAIETRNTSHSTLGLIRVLQTMLPESAREHIYLGVTVQDVTDTSMVMEIAHVGNLIWSDLRAIEETLLLLAAEHSMTPMVGRTHGQPGAPITFGYKAASWVDEISRSIERLNDLRERTLVCQLGGAVGSLAFFGTDALALRSAFASELGLGEPDISWLTARDRLGDFAAVLAAATAGLARIANEVFSLQRAEIGEVREATSESTVGSITMPHKRNPESSEQIVVLSRLVRSRMATLVETMVQEHERDARGWKAEWVTFPELCHYACAATAMTRSLVEGLEVDRDQMLANLRAGSANSEQMLRALSEHLGKHSAQDLLQQAYLTVPKGGDLVTEVRSKLPDELADIELPSAEAPESGASAEMVSRVLETSKNRRLNEPESWC